LEKGTILMDNYFNTLNEIDVSEHTETKNGLSYLSWAWAWGELKKRFPESTYIVYENAQGWNYHTDGRTCWVKTGVTVNGIEHIEELPVMDYKNKSIPLENVTSFDVNKAIQRSLTKAVARHGLGLYIYAGEDLPESKEKELPEIKKELPKMPDKVQEKPTVIPEPVAYIPDMKCEMCKNEVKAVIGKNGQEISADEVIQIGFKNKKNPHKWVLCADCQKSL
jgi:hypothetical protein